MLKNLTPIYDIKKSYLENAEEGPFFSDQFPHRKFGSERKDFLGISVRSKIGVPAGPLLNSKWVIFAAKMGFDIVTYKTIRSRYHPSHHLPNVVFVDCETVLQPLDEGKILYQKEEEPTDLEKVGITNSFGIPSREPTYVIEDIAKAKASLEKGQVMIVSFVGTAAEREDFTQDFVKAALLAKEGGAQILEADFSCPNVKSCEGSVHKSVFAVSAISRAIRKAIPDLPLIIKIGVIEQYDLLEQVMIEAAKARVNAICGINTMSMRVFNKDNQPALGKERERSGVCGAPIRSVALDFVQKAAKINREHKLDLTIMGTGGITLPSHFDLFFDAGADVAMSATGMMFDPYLAMRYHNGK